MSSTLFDDDYGFRPRRKRTGSAAASPAVATAAPAEVAQPASTVSTGSGARLVAATDGSCLGNPGPAGWAYAIGPVGDDGEPAGGWAAGGAARETNNWGELMALLELLRAVPASVPLEVRMDSQYALNAAKTWRHGWRRKNWVKADGKPIANLAIVQELDRLLTGRDVVFVWVKAHKTDGTGDPLNEIADRRANAAATASKQGVAVNSGPGFAPATT